MRPFLFPSMILILGPILASCGGSPSPELAPPVSTAQQKPVISGALAGSLGKGLDEVDRQTAFDAQVLALDTAKRQTWRGRQGTFGFVEPGAESVRTEGACREYLHKIYIAGRPQSGRGIACRNASGAWNFIS